MEIKKIDPTNAFMMVDVISKILSASDDILKLSQWITSEMREMTGARLVLVVSRKIEPEGYEILKIDPDRKGDLCKSDDITYLINTSLIFNQIVSITSDNDDEKIRNCLKNIGFEVNIIIPLIANNEVYGSILLLGLPDINNVDLIKATYQNLVSLLGMVFRNASLIDRQEKIIQDRTSEIEERQQKLQEQNIALEKAIKNAQESEYRLKLATASGQLGIWDWNVKDNLLLWDDRMFELFGIDRDMFSNNIEAWKSCIHPEDKQRAIDETLVAINGTGDYNTTFRVLHPDGNILYLTSDAIIVRDNNGKPLRMIGINKDITEKKLAEENLQSITTKLEALINVSPLAITLLDDKGNVQLWNDAAEKMFGWSAIEVMGLPNPIVPIQKSNEYQTLSEQIMGGIGITNLEAIRQHKDGSLINVSISSAPLLDANGRIFGRMAILADITERKKAELLLKEKTEEIETQNEELNQTNQELIIAKQKAEQNEEKFRLMIKNSYDSFVLINEKGEQFYISDAAIRDTGFSIEELKGPIQNVIFPEDLEVILNAWNDLVSKKAETIRIQYRHKHKFKNYIWYEAVAQNFLNNPAINAVVANVRDITKIKETELELIKAKEKAEESDRLKTAFLQNMSHEIRTPMNAIMGFSDLLVKNFDNKAKLNKFSDIIGQRCNDLLEIINDILDIAKIESGQLSVNVAEFNLSDLFVELSAFFVEYQKRIGKEHIKFVSQEFIDPSRNIIISDKIKLKQIFINLINNAFKFTDTGKIECGCKLDSNNNLLFYVSDTGIGIPENKQKAVFERFIQLHDGSRKNIGGTGLGLPIVKGLIELLGGEIFLESIHGKGSTFSFSILYKTVNTIPIESLDNKKINNEVLMNKTILIVEDDYYNLEYLKEILSGFGLNILQTEFAKDAIDISLSLPVDLVLMDIRLPDLNGYEATNQILQHKPHMKIIAQTAYASYDEKQKATDAGCVDYISKPTKRELLLSMISNHLSS
jgi:PAS domain S-box-containing protein